MTVAHSVFEGGGHRHREEAGQAAAPDHAHHGLRAAALPGQDRAHQGRPGQARVLQALLGKLAQGYNLLDSYLTLIKRKYIFNQYKKSCL